jgi:hypothetical protein
MTTMGSLAEWQIFSSRGAKPPGSFRDRGSVPIMAADGWGDEWRLPSSAPVARLRLDIHLGPTRKEIGPAEQNNLLRHARIPVHS